MLVDRSPTSLFDNIKACENCKRPLPRDYKEALCPACIEARLFYDVRDYIRENDVNEYQVADHFNISIRQVKAWIREGRIEYKTDNSASIAGLHCQRCGAAVSFGALCPKCLKILNGNKGYGSAKSGENNKMRFLDESED